MSAPHTSHFEACARLDSHPWSLYVCSLASMCQKEEKAPGGEPTRTALEDGLFRYALSSLDVIYAHNMLASLLSTQLPDGVVLDRG